MKMILDVAGGGTTDSKNPFSNEKNFIYHSHKKEAKISVKSSISQKVIIFMI